MLQSLIIQDVVLIKRLNIEFHNGLCVLTGETGAGKSILLDSLGLAVGMRAESGLVRKGADQAQVTATFDLADNHPVHALLAEQGLESDCSLILRRIVTSDGRSRAFINDQPVSVGLLNHIGTHLIEIHGQFETHGLLNTATHRALLDSYAAVTADIEQAWNKWQVLKEELGSMQLQAEQARAQEDYLRQALEDIDELDPQPGEEEKLSALRDSLMNREQILEALNLAYHALNAENDPAREAWSALHRIADKLGNSGQEALAALDRAAAEIQEALSLIQSLSSDIEESEHDLGYIDDRLFALKAQARKHSCAIEELPEIRQKLAEQMSFIENTDEELAQQMKEVDQAREDYIRQASALSKRRKEAAHELDRNVKSELEPLKLGKALFLTAVEELPEKDWGPHGWDRVQFLVATNPGSEPAPLNKIASGGEMARFMLALRVVMAQGGEGKTLVFDEVDSGIGGATADAVGERLSRLTMTHQTLVVTHSPQVAARSRHHYIVHKDTEAGPEIDEVVTNITYLEEATARREEIARMLSGAKITTEARAAAEKLLETGT